MQWRSEAGAEGSVAPSLKFYTNILMHFYDDQLEMYMYLKQAGTTYGPRKFQIWPVKPKVLCILLAFYVKYPL
jgi:hypothetical protein